MALFTGTKADEIILTSGISPTVVSTDNHTSTDPDIIKAKGGDDVVEGGGGDDEAKLGKGNDTFLWSVDHGSDIVDGGAGFDTFVFDGAAVGEAINIGKGAGGGARITDDHDDVVHDLKGIERIEISTWTGQDDIHIGDLGGTGVKQVVLDLAGPGLGGPGDEELDEVFVDGGNGADQITITGAGSSIKVKGLPARVTIHNADGDSDRLTVKGYGGDDRIDASAVPGDALVVDLEGGGGSDVLIGNTGRNVLTGGAGKDILKAGNGKDLLIGGNGNDDLTGGKGGDAFRFLGDLAKAGIDRIRDFKLGEDQISLGEATFAAVGAALDEAEFATITADEDADISSSLILYNRKTGGLFYNADGNGSGEAVQFATLDKHLDDLSHTDFNVYAVV